MKYLFCKLFPFASTSADLAQVEKELQAQIDALRSRIEVGAAQAGVIHESNEIILGSLRGRVTALEARVNAQAAMIDALETEVSRPLDPEIEARLNAVREAIKGANASAVEQARELVRSGKIAPNRARVDLGLAPIPSGDAKLVGLDISDKSGVTSLVISDGEAKATEIIRLKPTKGPKGGARK